jgi:hypothetical protein
MIITFDCQKYHAQFAKYFSPFSRFPKIVLVLVLVSGFRAASRFLLADNNKNGCTVFAHLVENLVQGQPGSF